MCQKKLCIFGSDMFSVRAWLETAKWGASPAPDDWCNVSENPGNLLWWWSANLSLLEIAYLFFGRDDPLFALSIATKFADVAPDDLKCRCANIAMIVCSIDDFMALLGVIGTEASTKSISSVIQHVYSLDPEKCRCLASLTTVESLVLEINFLQQNGHMPGGMTVDKFHALFGMGPEYPTSVVMVLVLNVDYEYIADCLWIRHPQPIITFNTWLQKLEEYGLHETDLRACWSRLVCDDDLPKTNEDFHLPLALKYRKEDFERRLRWSKLRRLWIQKVVSAVPKLSTRRDTV